MQTAQVNELLWINVSLPVLTIFCCAFSVPKDQISEVPLVDLSAIQEIFQLATCSLYAANAIWICSFSSTAVS